MSSSTKNLSTWFDHICELFATTHTYYAPKINATGTNWYRIIQHFVFSLPLLNWQLNLYAQILYNIGICFDKFSVFFLFEHIFGGLRWRKFCALWMAEIISSRKYTWNLWKSNSGIFMYFNVKFVIVWTTYSDLLKPTYSVNSSYPQNIMKLLRISRHQTTTTITTTILFVFPYIVRKIRYLCRAH